MKSEGNDISNEIEDQRIIRIADKIKELRIKKVIQVMKHLHGIMALIVFSIGGLKKDQILL